MQPILSFRDLIAWQKAMELTDRIYEVTENFPSREWSGLAYQLRNYIRHEARAEIQALIAEVGRVTHGLLHSVDPTA